MKKTYSYKDMRFFKLFLTVLALTLSMAPAKAVTDKEMDQAKAIAAKEYLRWANDASGYLDEVEAKSMSDLSSKLKPKEKENLQAFNSVTVPADYGSWTKEKLVEFWAVTFFTSPNLNENGKRARSIVRKKIQAMTVSAPAKEETPAPKVAEDPVDVGSVMPEQSEATVQIPDAETAVEQQEEILSDQQAIAEDEKLAEEMRPEEDSHTWVYVLALVILVAIVVWLVVYAANVMKRQSGRERNSDNEESESRESTSELREQTKTAIARKNEEVKQLHERLQREEARAADMGMELERLKLENSRLHQQIVKMREESSMRTVPTPRRAPVDDEPRRETRRRDTDQSSILKVIYLGRANQRGIFVRADRRITPGNTIFRLDTNDGLVGTFHVVDEPEVVDVALSDPALYLATACTGEDFEDTLGVSRILTDNDGTAIFENGYWKVLRKTRIRYE